MPERLSHCVKTTLRWPPSHGSAQVSYKVYKDLLERAVLLLPAGCKVVFLADRGFVNTELMGCLRHQKAKASIWILGTLILCVIRI